MTIFGKIYNFISPGIFPFTICLFLLIFIFFYRLFNLPAPQELALLIQLWFEEYGLLLLLFAAFVEGVFVVGMYFPGSLAILLAVYTLGKTPLDLFYIGSIAFFAFLIANIINYYLGKFGYYRFLLLIGKKDIVDKMQASMQKHGNKTFFLTGFFPNFIAITSVCAGISNMNILKIIFLLASSLLLWITFWTITASFVIKQINLEDNNQSIYLLIVIFLWGVFLVIKDSLKKAKSDN